MTVVESVASRRSLVRTAEEILGRFWHEGESVDAIAEALGVQDEFVQEIVKRSERIEEEAKQGRQHASLNGARTPRFHLLAGDSLRSLPEPAYSVAGMFITGTTAELYGPQGSYKSFVVVDLSCAIATGHAWQGNAVLQPGPIVYIAAENHRGTAKRLRAWERHHGIRAEQFYMLPEPLLLLKPDDVLAFADNVAQQVGDAPVAVVFDTLSRCIPGANENAQEVMSAAVASIDTVLRRFPDAVALAVHHTGLAGTHSRGSSSFPYACDTQILCARNPGELTATIRLTKQREGEEGAAMSVRLELVPEEHSAVVVPAGCAPTAAMEPRAKVKPKAHAQRVALRALLTLAKPTNFAAWSAKTTLAASTFDHARAALSSAGLVEQKPNGDWFVTDDGRGQSTFPQWQL